MLKSEDVKIITEPMEKAACIRLLGDMLQKSGYTDETYTASMLETEGQFETVIGFGLAIPHGKSDGVKQSGMAILAFPNGTDWDRQTVRLVIGLAAKDEDHMKMLTKIALVCPGKEEVDRLSLGSVETIVQAFMLE